MHVGDVLTTGASLILTNPANEVKGGGGEPPFREDVYEVGES